jgi:transcriptional antiterminator NusG
MKEDMPNEKNPLTNEDEHVDEAKAQAAEDSAGEGNEPTVDAARDDVQPEVEAAEPEPEAEAVAPEDETAEPEAEAVAPEDGAEEAADETDADADAKEPETRERAAAGKGPAGAEEVDTRKSTMRWYVLHTYSGREAKVRDTIERLIKASDQGDMFGKVLVATEEVAEMKKGKKTVSKRKLFPSYILIEMEMANETWSLIENVPGVTHFVGGGKKPFPIPKRDVDRILGRMEKKEGIIPEVPFTLGEHVRVVDGPFADFTGVVDEINPERGKLKVLVSIFGRDTPVELDFLQVKTI